jgi:Amt family ammonium transporter
MKTFTSFMIGVLLAIPMIAWGTEEAPTVATNAEAISMVQSHADYLWTLIAAALVFFMQAGFAMVEAGFTRAKNAVNILMKNLMDFSMGSIAFWAIGFGLMFGASTTGWFGTSGFFLSDFSPGKDPWVLAFWMFQAVFAATAATIVSGAMAERTKFIGYLAYSVVLSAFIYPIFGSWAWGGLYHGNGWLEKLGFIDFAGSTVVHSIGGWMALAGAIVLGPRIGKFAKDGKVKPIPGHNLPLAALGVFILWLGWFGFNPGSTTAANKDIAMIFVNTNLAAAAGAILAMSRPGSSSRSLTQV